MSLELLTLLSQMKNSIGNSLSLEQQLFVSANWPAIMDFFNNDADGKVVRNFWPAIVSFFRSDIGCQMLINFLPSIIGFLNSEAGRKEIRNFVEEWQTTPEKKPQ